jgi:hypothetical protein
MTTELLRQITDIRILNLEKDNKLLKEDNKQKDIRMSNLEKDNKILTKNVNILMKRHYNLVLWQAYKNVEYYIIQKVTKYDKIKMESINTNLTEFIKNSDNSMYINDINNFIMKFKINNYNKSLGKLNYNRIQEAHPNPIELDELEDACNDMENIYNGIKDLYNNYKEVYDYFDNL